MKRHWYTGSVAVVALAGWLWASGTIPAVIPAAVPAAFKIGNGTKFQIAAAGAVSGDCAVFDAGLNVTGAGTGGGCGVGGGSVSSVSGTAQNGVETIQGGSVAAITTSGTVQGSSPVNAQTGTTYTIQTTDRGHLVTTSNGSSITVTIPQASATFPSGFYFDIENLGAGTATLTPTTSTIDGAATLALATNTGVRVFSDGTNYRTQRGIGGSGGTAASINLTGTLASLPAAGSAGRTYLTTDSLFDILRDTGSAWTYFIRGRAMTAAPASTTNVNLAALTAAISAYGPGYQLTTAPTQTNFNTAGTVHAKIGSNFTYTLGIIQNWSTSGSGGCGMLLSDGTAVSSNVIFYGYWLVLGGGLGAAFPLADVQAFNAAGLVSVFTGPAISYVGSTPLYLRVQETASNRLYSMSQDNGVTWNLLLSEANTAHFTTVNTGIGVQIGNADVTAQCTFVDWVEQ
jgi:hypothetical protein